MSYFKVFLFRLNYVSFYLKKQNFYRDFMAIINKTVYNKDRIFCSIKNYIKIKFCISPGKFHSFFCFGERLEKGKISKMHNSKRKAEVVIMDKRNKKPPKKETPLSLFLKGQNFKAYEFWRHS